jgi:hypothetical protein
MHIVAGDTRRFGVKAAAREREVEGKVLGVKERAGNGRAARSMGRFRMLSALPALIITQRRREGEEERGAGSWR